MAALRPAGRERRSAIRADDEAAQGKVLIHVLLARRVGAAAQAILNLLVGLEADERLMLTGAQGHLPLRSLNISGIDGLIQKLADALVPHDSGAVLRKQRVVLQEAHHVRLVLEAARGIAFESFPHDEGGGFVWREHLAAILDAVILIADRSLIYPITVHDAGAHPVLGLLGVLAALIFRRIDHQALEEDGVGILAEAE